MANTKTAQNLPTAILTIFLGENQVRDGEITQVKLQCEVKVVKETPATFELSYPQEFADEYSDWCEPIIAKSNPHYRVAYNNFTDTFKVQNHSWHNGKLAMLTTMGVFKLSGKDGFVQMPVMTKVLVVDETDKALRVKFDEVFAANQPGFCRQWIQKDGSEALIESIN